MKRIFWVFLILAFLLVNEYLSKFLLAIFVGDLEFSQAVERTFQYATTKSYLLSAGFRVIPFIAIGLFAAKSKVTNSIIGKVGVWIITLFTISFILYGYLGMQHSLFTNEHTSSTSALALIWIPIWAFLFVVVGAVALIVVSKIANSFQTRA